LIRKGVILEIYSRDYTDIGKAKSKGKNITSDFNIIQ